MEGKIDIEGLFNGHMSQLVKDMPTGGQYTDSFMTFCLGIKVAVDAWITSVNHANFLPPELRDGVIRSIMSELDTEASLHRFMDYFNEHKGRFQVENFERELSGEAE